MCSITLPRFLCGECIFFFFFSSRRRHTRCLSGLEFRRVLFRSVLHRDLKPSNIFLSRSWNAEIVPKVLDFGISKLVHDSQQATLTTDSAFIGTPHYASPELKIGRAHV